MNIASYNFLIARPQIPLSAMSAPKVRRREAARDAAAPEIAANRGSDTTMRSVVALSSTPGPPVPITKVPEGNLAARISISPPGTKPAEPGGSANRGGISGAGRGAAASAGGSAGSSSLPAAVSVSGGLEPHTGSGGAGAGRSGRLDLTPKEPYQPTPNARQSGRIDTSRLAPGSPPEKILSGSEIYTMHVNLPNLTSASGSWILNFAELDEDQEPAPRRKERLADPVPVHVTDPKYPQDLIKEHVQGEVVLYAIIRKNGSVDSIQVVRDLDSQLDRNAIAALEKWTFTPATRAGVPVDVEAVVHVPFRYTDPREYPASTR
jgi:TonB family protein